jgi:hypothetical protein
VRGHFEYAPEIHPILHVRGVGFEHKRADFLDLLGEWIVEEALNEDLAWQKEKVNTSPFFSRLKSGLKKGKQKQPDAIGD